MTGHWFLVTVLVSLLIGLCGFVLGSYGWPTLDDGPDLDGALSCGISLLASWFPSGMRECT